MLLKRFFKIILNCSSCQALFVTDSHIKEQTQRDGYSRGGGCVAGKRKWKAAEMEVDPKLKYFIIQTSVMV